MTKLTTFSLLFFLSLTVVFTSCKKDEDPQLENVFVLQGETYPLDKGYISDFGAIGNETYSFAILLASSGISFSTGGIETGSGDFVYIDLITSSATGLVEGTYNYDSTIVEPLTIFDLSFITEDGESFDITQGTVTVELNGSETALTFSVTVDDGSTVTGNFAGVLEAI